MAGGGIVEKRGVRAPNDVEENMPSSGTIARLNASRGFGFIQPDEAGEDVFFHATSVQDVRFDDLHEGQRVEFERGTDARSGRVRAEQVRVVA